MGREYIYKQTGELFPMSEPTPFDEDPSGRVIITCDKAFIFQVEKRARFEVFGGRRIGFAVPGTEIRINKGRWNNPNFFLTPEELDRQFMDDLHDPET